jgi:hypothetical protein
MHPLAGVFDRGSGSLSKGWCNGPEKETTRFISICGDGAGTQVENLAKEIYIV